MAPPSFVGSARAVVTRKAEEWRRSRRLQAGLRSLRGSRLPTVSGGRRLKPVLTRTVERMHLKVPSIPKSDRFDDVSVRKRAPIAHFPRSRLAGTFRRSPHPRLFMNGQGRPLREMTPVASRPGGTALRFDFIEVYR